MNRLRLSGSARPETCSAETVVPRMTKRSTPASTTTLENSWVRCGESAPATVTPAARISRSRWVMRSARTGAAVELLHPGGGDGAVEPGDLREQGLGVLVAGPQALEVEHADAAHLAERDRGRGAHDGVHRCGERPAGRSGRRRSASRPRPPPGRACAGRARRRRRRRSRRAVRACHGRSRSRCSPAQATGGPRHPPSASAGPRRRPPPADCDLPHASGRAAGAEGRTGGGGAGGQESAATRALVNAGRSSGRREVTSVQLLRVVDDDLLVHPGRPRVAQVGASGSGTTSSSCRR